METHAFDPSRHEERVPAIQNHHDDCGIGDKEEHQTHGDGQHVQ